MTPASGHAASGGSFFHLRRSTAQTVASADLLNPNQRRHFEVLFSMLEEELIRVERLSREPASSAGALTIVEDDLPPDFAARAQPLVAATRRLVSELAAHLRLGPRRISRRRRVHAMVTAGIIRIDDSSPEELRGYGALDPRFISEVGPALASIRSSLEALSALVAETPRKSASRQDTKL